MLGNNRTNKNMNFNYVIITNWKDRTSIYTCDNIEGYNKHLAKNADMCELIGRTYQQIKPVLDVDTYEAYPNIREASVAMTAGGSGYAKGANIHVSAPTGLNGTTATGTIMVFEVI